MIVLFWIVRVYMWMVAAWAIMTWLPFLRGSAIHDLLGVAVWPVLAPFSFLHFGLLGFGPVIPLLLLGMLERWLGKQAGLVTDDTSQQPTQPDGVVDVRDLRPATPPDGPSNSTGG